jgi:glutaredoxin
MWIKSELLRSGKEVEIINIEQDEAARARLAEAGILTVPVLEVDGELLIHAEDMMAKIGGQADDCLCQPHGQCPFHRKATGTPGS